MYSEGKIFAELDIRPATLDEVLPFISQKRLLYSFNAGMEELWQGSPELFADEIRDLAEQMGSREWLALKWSGFRWGNEFLWDSNSLVLFYRPPKWSIETWVEDPGSLKQAAAEVARISVT